MHVSKYLPHCLLVAKEKKWAFTLERPYDMLTRQSKSLSAVKGRWMLCARRFDTLRILHLSSILGRGVSSESNCEDIQTNPN